MISFDTNLLLYSLNQDCAEYHDASTLPETPDEATRQELNDLLVRVRLTSFAAAPSTESRA